VETAEKVRSAASVNSSSRLKSPITRRQSQASQSTQERKEGDGRRRDSLPGEAEGWCVSWSPCTSCIINQYFSDAKANKEMAEKAKGKGPLNAGQQGIKKSGKK